ncbi:hypothetical protein [Pendulispora albinea]|uniref:Uncharacterized protein n=1 Tax=Pendulispora albinea TaxID=2741071 RepID=A0ABZ2LSY4_9BACT
MADFELAVPGVIYIGSTGGRRQKDQKEGEKEGNKGESPEASAAPHVVHLGAAAGWMRPRGIRQWAREITVIRRSALSEAIRKDLGVTLPQEQVPPAKLPLTSRAAGESPFIAIAQNLLQKLVDRGVRVHTVGFDKISGGFYYLAEGGQSPPARVEGDLIEMISPALEAAGENADLDALLEGVIDRILLDVSKGDLGEAAVELAAALPRLCTDGRGTEGCDLEAFEREAATLAQGSTAYETLARVLASRLSSTKHSDVVTVPLFGEARREKEPVITVHLGSNHTQLSARDRWLVTGAPNREITLAPQRANTVRVPTIEPSPPSSNGGKFPSRAPSPRPAAGLPAAGAPAATPAPAPAPAVIAAAPVVSKPAVTNAPSLRASLPRPAPAAERKPAPAPEIVAKATPSELAPPEPKLEDLPLPPNVPPEPDFKEDAPLSEPVFAAAPELAEPVFAEPVFAEPEPELEPELEAAEIEAEEEAPAPETEAPPSPKVTEVEPSPAAKAKKPLPETPIFAAAPARTGRQEVEPEPMTQPSQRRRREMEEAQERAVRDGRRLALWLVIGLIFILVAAYVLWSRH